jgi:virginiamycin A acetyltransferase
LINISAKFGKFLRNFLRKLKYPKYYMNDVLIDPFSSIGKYVAIGKGTNINGKCFIDSSKDSKVTIGKYCAIAHNFRIRNRNHNVNYPNIQDKLQNRHGFEDLSITKGEIVIGNACWIGDNVIILPGVKVGNGVVIGAASVVTKEIPDYAIAAGNPAKVIRYRFSENVIQELGSIQWWDWNEKKIKKNAIFFNTDLSTYSGIVKDLIV